MYWFKIFLFLVLSACSGSWHAPSEFIYAPIDAGAYKIATFQHITDNVSPIHIYIEGDGKSFDANGRPTGDPTPRGTFLRDLAAQDTSPNVVYMARPCQYIMTPNCARIDWTTGRFSSQIIESVASVIRQISGGAPVVLIGYSGGAMVSGLVINNYPEIPVQSWVTIAGVLNHKDWTSYFNDMPLSHSLDMDTLPKLPSRHFIARGDRVVPNKLSVKWVGNDNLIVIDGATHSEFPNLDLF